MSQSSRCRVSPELLPRLLRRNSLSTLLRSRGHTVVAVAWPVATEAPRWNRVAFAAAHVVADPRAPIDPSLEAAIDWEATLAFRRHLWSHGFGVAEAMDTAQRGMGLDWPTSLELIRRSVDEARGITGAIVFSGAGTDHLAPGASRTPDDVIAAYEAQCGAIEAAGGRIILMASRERAQRRPSLRIVPAGRCRRIAPRSGARSFKDACVLARERHRRIM